jgi:hypothetical protein
MDQTKKLFKNCCYLVERKIKNQEIKNQGIKKSRNQEIKESRNQEIKESELLSAFCPMLHWCGTYLFSGTAVLQGKSSAG